MVDCIFATNGTVDKFVGDAILAVWGNIHSDGPASDAILAVRTARECSPPSMCSIKTGPRADGPS